VLCVLLAFPFLDLPSLPDRTWLRLVTGLRDGLQALLAAFLLRFLLIFPEGVSGRREGYRRQRWVFAPALALLPVHVASSLAPGSPAARAVEPWLLTATTLLFAAYVLAGIAVFVRKIQRRETWVRGSKLRLAALGLGLGVLPLTVAALARLIDPTHAWPLDELAVLALPLVPASFSLALLRSGVIDLAHLTRQALVAVFLGVPVALGAWLAADLLGPRLDPAARPVVSLLVIAALVALFTLTRVPVRALAGAIDRVLYPERRHIRRVADELGRALSESREPEAVIEDFLGGIRRLVDTRQARILEPHGDRWIPHGLDAERATALQLRDDSSLARLLCGSREVLLLQPDRATEDRRFGPATRAWIRRADAHVVAPLVSSGETVALLVLGPRAGGRDYGALHLYHVDSLCRQAAAALQNARLHEDDLARERVRTELQLAQKIQQQLLPQAPIVGDSITVCGRTVSSRSVGGDLHDHFTLSDGTVVVVVADASGKGIPASLLTSGVRTAVRETVRPGLPLAEAMAHVNRHVHGMTSVGNFIALFCAVVEPRTGVVEYCVAGIEPPLWVRSALDRCEPLTRGGPVLGVDPDAGYHAGTIRLEPGDTLVAYSDGVVDEENAEGEPFGPQRLSTLLRTDRRRDPGSLLASIFGRLEEFGAEESVDDTTVVVVRRSQEVHIGTKAARAEG
jgi:serine phosphatase RsbU (regulator of sigma subunit)